MTLAREDLRGLLTGIGCHDGPEHLDYAEVARDMTARYLDGLPLGVADEMTVGALVTLTYRHLHREIPTTSAIPQVRRRRIYRTVARHVVTSRCRDLHSTGSALTEGQSPTAPKATPS